MIPNGVLLINTNTQEISYANKELLNIVGASSAIDHAQIMQNKNSD